MIGLMIVTASLVVVAVCNKYEFEIVEKERV